MATDNTSSTPSIFRTLINGSHILHQHGILDAYGHLSVRHPEKTNTFLMPRNMAPALLSSRADIVEYRVDDASPVDPTSPPGYVERFIHSEIYRRHPEIHSVIHSHSPAILPFTITGSRVPMFDIAEFYSEEDVRDLLIRNQRLGKDLSACFESSENSHPSVVLMRGHGFTVIGGGIEECVFRAIYTAENARVQTASLTLQLAAGTAPLKNNEALYYLQDSELPATTQMTQWSIMRPWNFFIYKRYYIGIYGRKLRQRAMNLLVPYYGPQSPAYANERQQRLSLIRILGSNLNTFNIFYNTDARWKGFLVRDILTPSDISVFPTVLCAGLNVTGAANILLFRNLTEFNPSSAWDGPTPTSRYAPSFAYLTECLDQFRSTLGTPADTSMSPSWTHLVRFVATEDNHIRLGQLVDTNRDVGKDSVNGVEILVYLIEGSIFDGRVTDKIMHVKQILSPVDSTQCNYIRCLGLNYTDHANEANLSLPKVPIMFTKPRSALADPYPATINIPKCAQDDTSDYESELCVVIGKTGRDIPESEALDYVLGYTASNDVSARALQLATAQWSFSKGLDGSCPIGPVLVSPSVITDPQTLRIQGSHNGSVVQDGHTKDMIFSIAKQISYLSQGTTLEAGTIFLTGTPAGIGYFRNPRLVLKDGDEFSVEIERIGSLVNKVRYE
ncbi:hypothetical protein CNMCM6936_001871 [Aspergillus lentulus]|nr:hypothetical protein CNMCM6069_002310 [Aspergillus lentulus]KAF4168557.1 hypothetical protein CNMCM6936_001871 [Aspergillus lentulus]KAF4175717.1 hypothetical protein CNMCM8060_007085 [Aspergillus lentulus]KAF4184126.1 hypothetical protein CNMCM7927_008316 [Aspergillus lentulus]KAF4195174.1 hypothetical protein CNMCM8694_006605 [Aspergillus lentulus]